MNKENINKAITELNKMLGNLQQDSYPTTETDSTIKGIKKVLKIMNPSPAPAPAPKPTVKQHSKPIAKKVIAKKVELKKAVTKKTVKKTAKKK